MFGELSSSSKIIEQSPTSKKMRYALVFPHSLGFVPFRLTEAVLAVIEDLRAMAGLSRQELVPSSSTYKVWA